MAAKNADQWCDRNLIINDERRDILRACWIAAQNALVEKFTSANSGYMTALSEIDRIIHNSEGSMFSDDLAAVKERLNAFSKHFS